MDKCHLPQDHTRLNEAAECYSSEFMACQEMGQSSSVWDIDWRVSLALGNFVKRFF